MNRELRHIYRSDEDRMLDEALEETLKAQTVSPPRVNAQGPRGVKAPTKTGRTRPS
jgi:hypothetical protein